MGFTSRDRNSFLSELVKAGCRLESSTNDTMYLSLERTKLREVTRALSDMNAYFKTCFGCDETLLRGSLAMYYVFGLDELGLNVVLKVEAPASIPVFPSVVEVVPAADWCELEARDLLGVEFEERKVSRLVLPEDWPDGMYPLRKSFKYDNRPPRAGVGKAERADGLPVGPYHPVLHEPEYFELYGEGEIVTDVVYRGFHVHRGIEKLAESERMVYDDVLFLAERICGICGFVHSCCYAMAVEKAAGIEVPERAEFLRSVLLEVERIHSHLLWIGIASHIVGYDSGFMHVWRIREPAMIAAERLTGSRKMYGVNAVGGLRRDIDAEQISRSLRDLRQVRQSFAEFVKVLLSVPQVRRRASGTGVLPRGAARDLSVVGPVARASGLHRDVRKDYPYLAYRHISPEVPLYTEGDNLSRLLVRIDEVFESVELVEHLADRLPGGDFRVNKVEVPPLARAVAVVEAPRGEDIHFVITGTGRPYRWRVRAPTYQNIPALKAMLKGAPLADAPLTIASIDPCFSCTDRVVYCDSRSQSCRAVKVSGLANSGVV